VDVGRFPSLDSFRRATGVLDDTEHVAVLRVVCGEVRSAPAAPRCSLQTHDRVVQSVHAVLDEFLDLIALCHPEVPRRVDLVVEVDVHARRYLVRRNRRAVVGGDVPAAGVLVEAVSSGEKQVLAHERPGTPAHAADVPGVVETVVEVIVPMEIPDRRLVVIDERLRHAERAVVLLDGLFVVGRSARRLDPVVERLVAIRVVLELVGEFAR